ncbi:hypothetical protein NP493_40g10008 [Ridgeia piscesae]|uniref:Delta-like protein n=1 Tax=Ridgeia piscesae TaxID=27915 RepID=A0AAD9PC64_RIDPI|nr:hypothetical protein NP493_40g10008 [Ridgeia piscesae]
MNTLWTLTPARNVNQASWSRRTIMGTRKRHATSLTLSLRLFCEQNFYNSHCSQYCKASDGPRHYTCDSATGDQICEPGWEGNLCDIRSDDCIDNECTNGATCIDGPRRYTCVCREGFTGK